MLGCHATLLDRGYGIAKVKLQGHGGFYLAQGSVVAVQLVHKHSGATDSAQVSNLAAQILHFLAQGLYLVPGIGLHGLHLAYLGVVLHELGFHLVVSVGATRNGGR